MSERYKFFGHTFLVSIMANLAELTCSTSFIVKRYYNITLDDFYLDFMMGFGCFLALYNIVKYMEIN